MDKLEGKPGLYSARYSGDHGNYDQHRKKLLHDMAAINNRGAHFFTALALSDHSKALPSICVHGKLNGEIATYQIFGEYESDIKNNKLSVNSPLAKGLINKVIDDVVEINSPKGQKSYTIKSVKYV